MKKTKLAALAVALTLALAMGWAPIAGAWGGHGGGHGGYGQPTYTPEQQAAWRDYNKKTAPLARQLNAKQAEMDSLFAQGAPDTGKIQALAKEIGDLNGRLYRIDSEYNAKLGADGSYGSWNHHGDWGHGGHQHGGRR